LHVSIEYMFLGLFVVLAVTLSFSNMAMVNILPSREIEQSQLRVKAESILDFILLSAGNPPDWDESVVPEVFGLAPANSSDPYVLDIGKVYALLNSTFQREIPRLLGVQDEYGFYLKIVPLYLVDINETGSNRFVVAVRSFRGFPLPSANVTGYYGDVNETLSEEQIVRTVTNASGVAVLDYGPSVSGDILIVVVSVSGVSVTEVYTHDEGYVNSKVEGTRIVESDYPPINSTISVLYGGVLVDGYLNVGMASKVTLFRYVKIENSVYYVEFTMWRLKD